MSLVCKGPEKRLDYQVDWGAALADSRWDVEPAEPGGVALASAARAGAVALATLEGGVAGSLYRVTNRVRTAAGEEKQRSLLVRVGHGR